MTQVHHALTRAESSEAAGVELGASIRNAFHGAAADAVVVFASARHDYGALLSALADAAGTEVIVGASSAGEFTHEARGEGQVSAMALLSNDIEFAVGVGKGVAADPAGAAAQVASGFRGRHTASQPHRSALVMTDALAGQAELLVEQLTVSTGGNYQFLGGGAGDDGKFSKTHVFARREAFTDGVAALEMLSAHPVGVGVAHGWVPAGDGLRVTQADGSRLISLNGFPAVEAFKEHAQRTGQRFDPADPMPFFLHNVLGMRAGDSYRLRVPLACTPDGDVLCAASIPEGLVVHIMETTTESAVLAARKATSSALAALGGRKAAGAFVFDCVATRLRMGQRFGDELRACADLLRPSGFVGCNTYGQIARAEGQFSGFHNCTAVVGVIPQ